MSRKTNVIIVNDSGEDTEAQTQYYDDYNPPPMRYFEDRDGDFSSSAALPPPEAQMHYFNDPQYNSDDNENNKAPRGERFYPGSKQDSTRRFKLLLLLGILLILAAVGTVVGFMVGNKEKDRNNNTNALEQTIGSSDYDEEEGDSETGGSGGGDDGGGSSSSGGSGGGTNSSSSGFTTSTRSVFKSQGVGPFEVTVPIFDPQSSQSIAVYESPTDAQLGFEELGKWILNNAILRNSGDPLFASAALEGRFGGGGGLEPPMVEGAPTQEGGGMDTPVSAPIPPPPQVGNDANSFETNNQEQNVDRADFAKSDGTYIYTAYGSKLIILKAAEEALVLELEMPLAEGGGGSGAVPVPQDEAAQPTTEEEETDSTNTTTTSSARQQAIMYPGMFYPPQANIEALLLSTNRLAVVVSGYGYSKQIKYQESSTTTDNSAMNATTTTTTTLPTPPILVELLYTHVRLYDTSQLNSDGSFPLLGVQDLNGYFQKAYVLNGVAHLVTVATINTWDHLVYPAEIYHPNYVNSSSVEEYKAQAAANGPALAEAFGKELIAELSTTTGSLPTVAELRLLTETTSGVEGFENLVFGNGYANSMVQISSWNMTEAKVKETDTEEEPELEMSLTVQFLSTYAGETYLAEDLLVVVGQGSNFIPEIRGSQETSFLFGFTLDGATTKPAMSGSLPGRILNSFALDFVDGYLRVATTLQTFWFVDVLLVPSSGAAPVVEESTTLTVRQSSPEVDNIFDPLSSPFTIVADCPAVDSECMSGENFAACVALKTLGCNQVFYHDQVCNYEFDCVDDYEMAVGTGKSNCPSPLDSCVNGRNLETCRALELEQGCQSIGILESCPYQFECSASGGDSTGGGGSDGSDGMSSDPLASPFTIVSQCPELGTTCVSDTNYQVCQDLKARGCNEIFYHDQVCFYEFDCVDDYEMAAGTGKSNCPSPRDPCTTGRNFATCIGIEKVDGCMNVAILESCPYTFACSDGVADPFQEGTVAPTSSPVGTTPDTTDVHAYRRLPCSGLE
jgi:Beta propeller domain